ncbi:MAG: hypothetical protein JST83_09805 [Bacteroidetes bacterium]|nr:hypothetical protein [Bacteroidota bacterium]
MDQRKSSLSLLALAVFLIISVIPAQAQWLLTVKTPKGSEDITCRYYENNAATLLNNATITYFVAYNTNSPQVKKYLEVLKANWKITKDVELISFDQVKSKLAANAVFIAPTVQLFTDVRLVGYSIMTFADEAISHPDDAIKESDGNLNFYKGIIHKKFMIEQPWDVVKAQAKNGEKLKVLMAEDKTSMFKSLSSTNLSPFEMDENKFLAWNEDVFRQQLLGYQGYYETYVATDKVKEAAKDMKNLVTPAAGKLKTETLYIPDYVLAQQAKSNEPLAADKAMKDYPFAWKKLTNADFKKKLKTGEHFYYLHIDRLYDVHWLCEVIDAGTGAIVYTRYYCCDLALSPGMLKALKTDISK